jgi:hypothetical protein
VSELVFECVAAHAERWAAVPTVVFRLRIAETTGEVVHGIALRCQIRIEPLKRRYSDAEAEKLADLFGERSRWGDTMKPLQFAFVTQMVPGFSGCSEVDLPVTFSYDFEVACSKYFYALEDGEIPLVLLFSGTVFVKGETGFAVEQVPWHKESLYRLPVPMWREAMDALFPNSAWIRMNRAVFDALVAFKTRRGLPTWDDVITVLLDSGGEAAAGTNGVAGGAREGAR